MHITPRTHYYYETLSTMDYGLHWLVPYSKFRQEMYHHPTDPDFDKQRAHYETLMFNRLVADATKFAFEESKDKEVWNTEPLMFFIPRDYSPLFGFVWVLKHRAIIISPLEIPALRSTVEVGDYRDMESFRLERPAPPERRLPIRD